MPDGRYIKANPVGARLHGYDSASELLAAIGNIVGEVYRHDRDRQGLRQLLEDQVYAERFECQIYRHKTREVIWIRQNVYRVTDVQGRLLYFEGFVEDITDRKRVEGELRRARERSDSIVSERTAELKVANQILTEEQQPPRSGEIGVGLATNLRNVVDQAGDGFFIIDTKNGCFVDVNNQACTPLGYRRDELLDMTVADIDVEFPSEDFSTLIAGLKPDETTMISGMHRRKNGSLFPVEIGIGLIELQGQSRLLALARDVTEKRQAEEALRQSEKDFRQLTEGSIQGILIADPDRKPLFSNDEYAWIFGYAGKEESLALPSTLALIAPYEVARLDIIRRPFLKQPKSPIRYEFDGVKKDGDIITLECMAGTVNWNEDR